MRLDAAVTKGAERLATRSDSPRLDAELLLCQSIDVARSYLYGHPEDELDSDAKERFETLIARRAAGEPLAYIAGAKEFWSQELMVTPATLIPRPETERLVEHALATLPGKDDLRILDLGTGSGAIALALAAERPQWTITATDRSQEALAVARQNARQLGLSNIEFLHGDWTEPVKDQRFELIVSNPPYVRDDDPLLADLTFEPRAALESGMDGLRDLTLLAAATVPISATNGWLMLEHGCDQAADVAHLLHRNDWTEIVTINDLAGLPRVTVGRRNGK